VKFVDLRFTDTRARAARHRPGQALTKDKFELGHAFDGSSMRLEGIQSSDMLLMPTPVSARMDVHR